MMRKPVSGHAELKDQGLGYIKTYQAIYADWKEAGLDVEA